MTEAVKPDHVRLFIPGPTEVRREILEAQSHWMIGHRGADFETLFARVQGKLRQLFYTQSRVYVSTSSGTGLWEAASRNCVRDDKKVLHLVNGAFSERWYEVSKANGKQAEALEAEWGRAIKPEQLEERLRAQHYDAVAIVLNETSTGVKNPLEEMAAVIRQYPDTLILVDAVSILGGYKIDFDGLGLDVLLTSTQKAMALPPGLAFAAVSDRVLERAKQVPYRGYYFDFIELEKFLLKNHTPATPNISLLYATDKQLDYMLAEGLEARFARHEQMAQATRDWVAEAGFAMFSEEGYHSPTVTTVANTRRIDVKALNKFLKARGMTISDGYGKLKDSTFRIAHMGDLMPSDMEALFAAMNEFLAQA
ncbi:MAG: aminotransferase [Candidatus Thermofonsia Clade 1 bacterium]|jgi:predicted phosphoserine aminotransferase|uniref:Aminotransferase n=1 Tax=Candidatus Thermofonsia Clade 1 bacterium TaxID=2364210 RepID=A0A2M8PXR7_9CHLR|nr:MAG: aminotransferase [Candidatus Thermofonsia Clade 1 bacterium]PJF42339.1 MAG: aminotransferase [Candidatus Thermofonsia Clade 1 bacterium]RMF49905.1 MAG: alanine--glyoxylate aminotransferase family protein [Chloroflexota bacterium]